MRYTCVRQHDTTDCGAACLSTILRHYGSFLPIAQIREIAGTDRMGTSAFGIVTAAEKLGFKAQGVKGDREALFSGFTLPAIAHLVLENATTHYVVIHKITKDQILIADPAKGIVRHKPEDFFRLWTGVLILMTPKEDFQRVPKQNGFFGRFLRLVLPQKKLLLYIFALSLLITIAGILASYYYMVIMDRILPADPGGLLLPVSLATLALFVFKSGLDYARRRLMMHLSQRIDLSLIPAYNHHVLRLPFSFYGTRKVGEVVSRYVEARRIRDFVANASLTIMMDTLMTVAGGIVLFLLDKRLFLVALSVAMLYAAVVVVYGRPIRKANENTMEDNAQFSSYLYESVEGIETVKAMNAEPAVQNKSDRLYQKLWTSVRREYALNIDQTALTRTIAVIGETVILWIGTASVLSGELTIGALITFHALLAYFLTPMQNLLDLQPIMQTAVVAMDRLGDVMDLLPEQEGAPPEQPLGSDIRIDHLFFRYGTRELVLRDISISVRPGERIAFVGESGSGKTTISKLLLRFYDWESGSITIGGRDLRQIPVRTLRDHIAYISQDTFLFSGTIRENLMLAKPDATDDELREACRISRSDAFIERLPQGYETYLDENGQNLSGGQRQRLAIARALLRSPKILILDEATSNLDSVTEQAITSILTRLGDSMTIITIAHRLSTVRYCDAIYVLEQGQIVESGSHEALLAQKGIYAGYWAEQSDGDGVQANALA
ncbi:MAG: peptidase domain-containing ABC transporter [Christensenellaceae bacterium]|nr:peptidase domain-containing ABC transporter [Christensenellaceae bacterium]